jgi:hypothetical protein
MKHFISIIFIGIGLHSICFAQKNITPIFKSEIVKTSSFNKYFENFFYNDSIFYKYFKSPCGEYYHEVKFNIDKNAGVTNLSFDNPPSYMTEFIKDMLIVSAKNWELTDTMKIKSKTVVLPIYFYFTDDCDTTPKSIHYYSAHPEPLVNPFYKYGLIYQQETKDKILLWPIKFNGPFIHRIYPYMKSPRDKVGN